METNCFSLMVALRSWVKGRRIWLQLADRRIDSCSVTKYPLLADAPQS